MIMNRLSTTLLAGLAGLAVLAGAPAAHAAGDPAKGKTLYGQCAACHKADNTGKSTIGPNLWKVVGRTSGTLPGFTYSPAMKSAKRVWTEPALDVYLAAPAQALPGNRMPYPGMKAPADRANLIAYLKTLK